MVADLGHRTSEIVVWGGPGVKAENVPGIHYLIAAISPVSQEEGNAGYPKKYPFSDNIDFLQAEEDPHDQHSCNYRVACLIAAIVGGGLKAFGIEVPAIASIKAEPPSSPRDILASRRPSDQHSGQKVPDIAGEQRNSAIRSQRSSANEG